MNPIDGGIGSFSFIFSTGPIVLLLVLVAPFMLVETLRSVRNERGLRQRGAIEPADDPYGVMSLVYPTSFIAMAVEGAFHNGPAPPPWLLVGVSLFACAKLLKFWAIATLGDRWTFRVLVPPGAPMVARGPYQYLRHPNYVAVLGELLGVAVFMPAPTTGILAIVAFSLILWKRIAVEERALGLRP
jgi:methyltransferase